MTNKNENTSRSSSGSGEREAGFRAGVEAAAQAVQARVARPGMGTMEAIADRRATAESIRALASPPPAATRTPCMACEIEAAIGTEESPHPVPREFHACASPAPTPAPKREE